MQKRLNKKSFNKFCDCGNQSLQINAEYFSLAI